jgi:hypothetical protein
MSSVSEMTGGVTLFRRAVGGGWRENGGLKAIYLSSQLWRKPGATASHLCKLQYGVMAYLAVAKINGWSIKQLAALWLIRRK